MIAVLAVSLAIAVIACVWLGARGAQAARQRDEARSMIEAAEARAKELDETSSATAAELSTARAELQAATARVDEAEEARRRADEEAVARRAAAEDAEARATDLEARATAAEGRTVELEARASDAEGRATEAATHAEQLGEQLVELESRIEELATTATTTSDEAATTSDDGAAGAPANDAATSWGPGPGPDTLWNLELARTRRTWRTSVSADPTADAFDDDGDALRTAVEIDIAAIREEAGVEIELTWDLDALLPPVAALAVLRAAQELLAATTRIADEACLRVTREGTDVVLSVRSADGEVGRFVELTGVVDGRGIFPVDGGVRVAGIVVDGS